MNTKIHYMYRDASNYKQHTYEIAVGTAPQEEIDDLFENHGDALEQFYPGTVGFQSCSFADAGWEPYDDDPDWHELVGFEETDDEPTQPITISEFIETVKSGKTNTSPVSYMEKCAAYLKSAICSYCHVRLENGKCSKDICGFCPVNRTLEMAKKDEEAGNEKRL